LRTNQLDSGLKRQKWGGPHFCRNRYFSNALYFWWILDMSTSRIKSERENRKG
jgi:hypothetical protein